MKNRKRLTRQESKEATRTRLIEAAEKVFIRKGFDDASVEEIAETAGFSRGAFYSNFTDKDELFLAVANSRYRNIVTQIQDILHPLSDPGERINAARTWFANQWRAKNFVALRMEFSRRAMRNPAMRKRLANLWRQEVEAYAGSLSRYAGETGATLAAPAETIALALLAVVLGLGSMALDAGPEVDHPYDKAAMVVFERLIETETIHRG